VHRAFRSNEVVECSSDLLAHHTMLDARSRERWALVGREREAHQLAQKFADAFPFAFGQVLRELGLDQLSGASGLVTDANPCTTAQSIASEHVR
jgi:hypothetical protein